jgi:hypothetical protein
VFLVEESLHDESGLIPLLSRAEFPHASIRFCKKGAHKIMFITGVNANRLINVLFRTPAKSLRTSLAFNTPLQSFLSQGVLFFAYSDSVFPQLCTEDFLYHQNSKKCFNIYTVEQSLKSPAYSLSCHPEGFMNLFSIRSL